MTSLQIGQFLLWYVDFSADGDALRRQVRRRVEVRLGHALLAGATSDARVAASELAPELLDDLARRLGHRAVRERDRHAAVALVVGDHRLAHLAVRRGVQVVGEARGLAHDDVVLDLDEALDVQLLAVRLALVAGLEQVFVVRQDLLERVDALEDLVGDVDDRAVTRGVDAARVAPGPEGVEPPEVRFVRAALGQLVRPVEVDEFGELPEQLGLGLGADDGRRTAEGVEVEVADADHLDAFAALVVVRAGRGVAGVLAVVGHRQDAALHGDVAVLGLDGRAGLALEGGGQVGGVGGEEEGNGTGRGHGLPPGREVHMPAKAVNMRRCLCDPRNLPGCFEWRSLSSYLMEIERKRPPYL